MQSKTNFGAINNKPDIFQTTGPRETCHISFDKEISFFSSHNVEPEFPHALCNIRKYTPT